jgi:hypothetical protein
MGATKMFNYENRQMARIKKKILTLVLSEKKILNETKNYNHPLQVKWSVPYGKPSMY